jgi:hypothetical protein
MAMTASAFRSAATTGFSVPCGARLLSVTDAPLTSPEFAEALRAFGKDVVAVQ